jgi:hypothetical protein
MKKMMNQEKWTRRPSRYRFILLLAALMLLLQPLPALAAEVSLPELGLSLSLPNSLDVFTRSMSPDDPLLKLKGQSAEQVRDELSARGISLDAQDIAGAYAIQLSAAPDHGPDFSELGEAQLGEIAEAYGAGQFEILRARQAAFLLLKNGGEASCLTRVKGWIFTLRLTASSQLHEGMVKTIRSIAQSMDFGVGQ